MAEYVAAALFVYTDDTKYLIDPVQNNSARTRITAVAFEAFMQTRRHSWRGLIMWWLQDLLK